MTSSGAFAAPLIFEETAQITTPDPAYSFPVQADFNLRSVASGTGSRWFGLVARYMDPSNYYYVTARNDQTISLRKLVNGSVQVLDSAPLAVAVGRSYALRMEAIGNSLRVYVNGAVVLEASDASHPRGTYGAAMYKSSVAIFNFLAWQP